MASPNATFGRKDKREETLFDKIGTIGKKKKKEGIVSKSFFDYVFIFVGIAQFKQF